MNCEKHRHGGTGHLKDGVHIRQAQSGMDAVAKRIEQENPQTNTGIRVDVIPLPDQQADSVSWSWNSKF